MAIVIGKDEQYVKRTSCYKCSSVIQYTLNEVQKDKQYDYTGSYDIVNYIQCPCCGHKISVKGY